MLVKKMIRLQKAISEAGVCSRREAEKLILQGKVEVNGMIVKTLGTKVKGDDVIFVNGKEILKEEKEYYLLYKPRGVISSSKDEKGRKTVVDLIDTNKRLFPVGRLDYDTSGIILLTNDGELSNKLLHPSKSVEKTYVAKVEGLVIKPEIKRLENGINIDGIKTKKAKAKLIKYDKKNDSSYIKLTITEGRNHQVKKMFEEIGHEVKKLKRESFSFLDLTGLRVGEYRKLNTKEVKKLYSETNL